LTQIELAIMFPARAQETALRLPSHGERFAAVEHPRPIHALVDCSCKILDLGIIEMLANRQHAAEQKRGVDRGEFTIPYPLPCFDINKKPCSLGNRTFRNRSVCRTRSRIAAAFPYPRDSPMQRPLSPKPVSAILATRRWSLPLSSARSRTWPVVLLASFQKKSNAARSTSSRS
jgi:hypothetical protein